MRRTSLPPVAFALSLAFVAPGHAGAGQFDPLRRVREKMEKLQKKVECAVNDKACIEKAQKEGAEVKINPAPNPNVTAASGAQGAGQAAGPTLDAAVRSTPLAPLPAMGLILHPVVSDDGSRAAGPMMKGSRFVMVVDGQEGPLFDQITHAALTAGSGQRGAAVFGPGGKHVAYAGVRAGATIAVVDGKEGPPFTSLEMNNVQSHPNFGRIFHFSDDGTRVAYVGVNVEVGKSPPQAFHVVLDGTPGPPYARILDMVFAGNRHAYVAMKADQKQVLVIDGKEQTPAFGAIQNLQGNADGHVAFIGTNNMSWSVVVDGTAVKTHQRPAEEFDGMNFVLAPVGTRIAYVAVLNQSQTPGARAQLYVGGKVARSAVGFHRVFFSPNGARLAGAYSESAASGPMRQQRQRAFVDDWTSQDYDDVTNPMAATSRQYSAMQFSPDGNRFAFIARNGVSSFLVVDGQESSGYGTVQNFRFSPDSRHWAFESFVQGQGWAVVVDGKEGPKANEIKRDSLTFSPDGSRFAYALASISDSMVVIDGQPLKTPIGHFQPRVAKEPVRWQGQLTQHFVFSPDGKRLAYVNPQPPSMKGGGVVMLDGQAHQVPGHLFAFPTFSADGKRFAYASWMNQKWFLVIDGKSMPMDGDLYEVPRALAFEADGSLRVLVAKDNMLHRVLVSAKAGTD